MSRGDFLRRGKRLAFLQLKTLRQRVRLESNTEKRVIFLSGVPRSGTNITLEVLEHSYDTDVFREGNPRAFRQYEMREEPVIRRLVERSQWSCVVFKALLDGHKIRELMDAFAPAQTVWVFRHFDDVVNSILVHMPGFRNFLDEIVQDPQKGHWRGKGMTQQTHAILRQHYRPKLDDASATALFWFYRNQLFFDQGLDQDPRVGLVRYEALVNEPETITALALFCNVSTNPRMFRLLRASSIRKQAEPRIDPQIRALCDDMHGRLLSSCG